MYFFKCETTICQLQVCFVILTSLNKYKHKTNCSKIKFRVTKIDIYLLQTELNNLLINIKRVLSELYVSTIRNLKSDFQKLYKQNWVLMCILFLNKINHELINVGKSLFIHLQAINFFILNTSLKARQPDSNSKDGGFFALRFKSLMGPLFRKNKKLGRRPFDIPSLGEI